jgi:hypothetical protein
MMIQTRRWKSGMPAFFANNTELTHSPERVRVSEGGSLGTLILLATISLLQAAMGRVFFVLATGGGPGLRPGLGPSSPAWPYDWRTRGRPHRVWLIGAAVMTVVILRRGPLIGTWWAGFRRRPGAHRLRYRQSIRGNERTSMCCGSSAAQECKLLA